MELLTGGHVFPSWWSYSTILYIYLPVFFNLELVNAYEYLERRFDRKTKLLASSLYVLDETLLSSIVAYSPCLALSAGKYHPVSD
jgi:uncharacterized sodium:solute symporter family permease YidK